MTELANLVDMPVERVRRALPYLQEAALFGSSSSIDLRESDAYIVCSEELIRHGSLDDIVIQRRAWLRERIRAQGYSDVRATKSLRGLLQAVWKRPIMSPPFARHLRLTP